MIHKQKHLMAGKTVTITSGEYVGNEYRVEDLWDRVYGASWMDADGNPAAMQYGIRSGFGELPLDDEVLYGKIGAFGHLVHVSEIDGAKTG